jgi:hypothetical protein
MKLNKNHKWYVRHDFCPELIPKNWELNHYKYMVSIGNVFTTKDECVNMCNEIRTLFNAPLIL